ncbi:MAG: 2,3-epoxybenzoyl-CoA dihydrolase [Tepidiformaceae bacterium]
MGDGAAGEAEPWVDFRTEPGRYRHWKLEFKGERATLTMDVDEAGGLFPGCELKLNSYDLGVDIELADAVQRIRIEHPKVRVVLLRSGKERVFSAGANIRMLASASHRHKVNFCKFTNETRNAIEDASQFSGQKYLCVIEGTAAGGGYELALTADHIILIDDGSSAVSLPEVALLAVLPGTGGLTRLTDKRRVRRDIADVFCTTEEGVKGRRAVEWRLVDEVAPRSRLAEATEARLSELAAASGPAPGADGIALRPLARELAPDAVQYSLVRVDFDRSIRAANVTVRGPEAVPVDIDAFVAEGEGAWAVRCARELDDAILHLRFNEADIATLCFRTRGDARTMLDYDAFLGANTAHWLVRETTLYWKRMLKRIDLTSRSLVALIEPGSCFAGTLAELAFACDRSYMLSGGEDVATGVREASLTLSPANQGWYPMSNGLTRLQTRFLGEAEAGALAEAATGVPFDAAEALRLGLVTFALDGIDWDDEVRLFLEGRAGFSADALTGMEANLRFGGPETMETKIFARLTAWQNWIFQRPNATGPEGSLRRYGSGQKAQFDTRRV